MATNVLTCFERLDGSRYWHPNCLNATAECESEQFSATLCGWEEAEDPPTIVKSTPPKKYLKMTWTVSGQHLGGEFNCPTIGGVPYNTFINTFSGSTIYEKSSLDCSETETLGAEIFEEDCECVFIGTDPFDPNDYEIQCEEETRPVVTISPSESDWYLASSQPGIDEVNSTTEATAYSESGRAPKEVLSISIEDTEQDAIDRETPTEGTSCSSLWETRNTGFSFTYRTSEYTIECVGLVIGVEYEVTPIIQRRTAVIGSYGAWEDVTVASETFTATATTKTLPAVLLGDDGNGEIIQGYQYEITDVHIEKKA